MAQLKRRYGRTLPGIYQTTQVKSNHGPLQIDLRFYWDRWTDPGDYPSNAGGGPLPPGRWYVEDITGEIRYRISPAERWELIEFASIDDWANDAHIAGDLPYLANYRLALIAAEGDLLRFQVVQWESREDWED